MLPIANKLPTACIVLTTLDYIYYSVGTNKCVQNLIVLPDANELPDENTLWHWDSETNTCRARLPLPDER